VTYVVITDITPPHSVSLGVVDLADPPFPMETYSLMRPIIRELKKMQDRLIPPPKRRASKILVVGGIEGKDLDNLALTIASETPAEQHEDLRYVLEKALAILDRVEN
jgi:hypothetical protein